jgi:hypothetical protein
MQATAYSFSSGVNRNLVPPMSTGVQLFGLGERILSEVDALPINAIFSEIAGGESLRGWLDEVEELGRLLSAVPTVLRGLSDNTALDGTRSEC